jgi:hypothetical protein
MGGVDIHDQLRLQRSVNCIGQDICITYPVSIFAYCRYSLQLAVRFKKYYVGLFFGLMDIAIVNSFIVHNAVRRRQGQPVLSHVAFLKQLHLELIQLQAEDLEGASSLSKPPQISRSVHNGHRATQVDEWREGNKAGHKKRRQRVCKVCSLLRKSDERASETSWYCGKCAVRGTPTYLCMRPRHQHAGDTINCFDMWHKIWKNGTVLPRSAQKRRIRTRPPSSAVSSDSAEDADEGDDEGTVYRDGNRTRTAASSSDESDSRA